MRSTLLMTLSSFVVVKAKLKLIQMSILPSLLPFSLMKVKSEFTLGSIADYTIICLRLVHLEAQSMHVHTKAFMCLNYVGSFISMCQTYCLSMKIHQSSCRFIFLMASMRKKIEPVFFLNSIRILLVYFW